MIFCYTSSNRESHESEARLAQDPDGDVAHDEPQALLPAPRGAAPGGPHHGVTDQDAPRGAD